MIQGVVAASITPHQKDGDEVDIAATLELIDFLKTAGVRAISLLGATGEFLHLRMEDRIRLARMAVKRSTLPVLVGVSHSTLDGALDLARQAVRDGAAALSLMPPYFYRYSQPDIRQFYLEFASRSGGSVPVLLHNIPAFTNDIAFETAAGLLSSGLYAGIEDSSGQVDYFAHLKELCDRAPFNLLAGSDDIFTQVRQAGAHGVVSGVACAIPELVIALDAAICAGQISEVARLDARLREFLGWIGRFPAPVGVKAATLVRGIKAGPITVPLAPATQKLLGEFEEWLKGWLPNVT